MFSCEGNTGEAARVCWCCQLCLTLVTELSELRCSHLRSWQPTVVSEQQTHFTITPLSLTPAHTHTPFLLISFDIPPLFTHLIYCFFSSSYLVSPTFTPELSLPPLYDFVVSHPPWLNTLPVFFFFLFFSFAPLSFSHSIFHLVLFSDSLTSLLSLSSRSLSTSHLTASSIFHCLLLKIVFSTEVTGEEYSYKRARLL